MIKSLAVAACSIAIGFGLAEALTERPAYAYRYGAEYGDKPYIPGCKWNRSEFTCAVRVLNYIRMEGGIVVINPKRKR